MLTPRQISTIRAHHERAARLVNCGQLPTNAELIQAVHYLGDMLTHETDRTRP